ncbi:hypothetical protein CHL67_04030 [Prosthecochloris sp. GSB1]|uniref:DUF4136 domain-containing protein n=1 Tax=Prosthecochloris sp. GSB1 TaxID=281093 RepID=UPI000B8C8EC7|nr:DUF4136 domain-containing protein [Prosthecochloris sp. GSB1]ASQ91614.1 hypothetical protein CHL67_04030 [Prosthecochloris sp. GSB1]
MKRRTVFAALFMAALLGGCSTVSVVTDYDRDFDFSGMHTYRWPTGDEGIRKSDALVENPLVYKRVQAAVDSKLQARGFRLADSKEADFIVHAHAGVKKVRSYYPQVGLSYGFGHRGPYRSWWGPYGGYTYVGAYEEGSLLLDVIDARKKELTWRGVATGVVRRYRTPEAMQRDIDEAVAKILEQFPPGAPMGEAR